MQTTVLYLCYIVLILLFSTAYNTSLIYCFVIWCLHTNKRRLCSSTLSGHPSSSLHTTLSHKTFVHTSVSHANFPTHYVTYIVSPTTLLQTHTHKLPLVMCGRAVRGKNVCVCVGKLFVTKLCVKEWVKDLCVEELCEKELCVEDMCV